MPNQKNRPPDYTTVTAPDKADNGSVSVSPKNAIQGSTVTVKVTPDSGYVVDRVTVTDNRGNEVKLTQKGVGTYTFTMPAGQVTVTAAFAPAGCVRQRLLLCRRAVGLSKGRDPGRQRQRLRPQRPLHPRPDGHVPVSAEGVIDERHGSSRRPCGPPRNDNTQPPVNRNNPGGGGLFAENFTKRVF